MRLDQFVGDRSFYKKVFSIAIPIVLQNCITSFVNMLDNIMIGQLSTAEISAVTIINNNLLFIFNLCLFGANSGAEIFITQFFGVKDHESIRYCFRFKTMICVGITLLCCLGFLLFSDPLISLYLQGDGDAQLAADTLHYSRQYLFIMLLGLLPFGLNSSYAGTLRSCGKPMIAMVSGMIATGVNLVWNYILIFGHFGFPALGIAGAAIATVISRYVEVAIVFFWAHFREKSLEFIKGLYKSLYVPASLIKSVIRKGLPLLFNECLWAFGTAFMNQCYSTCGLGVVPALSISSTIYNFAGITFRSMGVTVGIYMGHMLGSGAERKELHLTYNRLATLSIAASTVFAVLMASLSGLFPLIYNTSESIRGLATNLILINAAFMCFKGYDFPVYFTLRAGGKTAIAAVYDSVFMWTLSIPLAFILSRFTDVGILLIFTLCHATDIIKCIFGAILIRKGTWIHNLTRKDA